MEHTEKVARVVCMLFFFYSFHRRLLFFGARFDNIHAGFVYFRELF